MKGLGARRQFVLVILSLPLSLAAPACYTSEASPPLTPEQAVPWDLVVVGRIDACWSCQHEPWPHVSYTKVLAGKAPNGQPQGELNIVEVPPRLLPEGSLVYRSERAEICYLKLVVPPIETNPVAYKVVEVEEATPERLAKFNSIRQR
jgi:hypothetical protein